MPIITPPGLTSAVAQSLAPLRTRLTKTLASGLALRTQALTNTTFLHIIPIEAPCYGARIGFGNCFNAAFTVVKASIYPSDSYSVLAASSNAGLKDVGRSTQYAVVPTGGAAGCPLYFDNAGADVATLNTSGSARSFTSPAVSANAGNANQSFVIQWSDFVPCTSIPRADGGTQHLLFVYVTITTAGSYSGNNMSSIGVTNADSVAHRNRYFWVGQAWNGSTDFADNPTGTGFKQWNSSPLFAIQYLTAAPGTQVVLCGDSLTAAPTDDAFTSSIHRAGWDLSTPSHPIEVASMAWGGTASAVYEAMMRNNAAAIRPSAVAWQPLSRNDTYTTAGLQVLLAKALADDDTFRQLYNSKAIWNMPGCMPSSDGNGTQIAAFNDMRARLNALAASCGIPVIDGPATIGNVAGAAPWDYLATFSTDNTHPNFVGSEALVPQAKAALHALTGR